MMRAIPGIPILALMISSFFPRSARACVDPPTGPVELFVTEGMPGQVILQMGFWNTFASGANDFCVCSFRLPTIHIQSVDAVLLLAPEAPFGGGVVAVGGFGSWDRDASIDAEIESILAAGASEQWFSFFNDLTSNVDLVSAGFAVFCTLQPGSTAADVEAALLADGLDRIFTDEADSGGSPTGGHQGFTDLVAGAPIPTVTEWGLLTLTLALLTAGIVFIRRRRAQLV